MEDQIDDIEELKRWIAFVAQNARKANTSRVTQAIDALLLGVSQLTNVMQSKCPATQTRQRSRKAKPPTFSPAKQPQQQARHQSSADTPNAKTDAEDRSEGRSRIQQGIRQALPKPVPNQAPLHDRKRTLRQQTYGTYDYERQFQKASKALAS